MEEGGHLEQTNEQTTEQTSLSGGLFNLILNSFFIFLFNLILIIFFYSWSLRSLTRGHLRSLMVIRGHSYVVLVKIGGADVEHLINLVFFKTKPCSQLGSI